MTLLDKCATNEVWMSEVVYTCFPQHVCEAGLLLPFINWTEAETSCKAEGQSVSRKKKYGTENPKLMLNTVFHHTIVATTQ